MSGNQKRGNRLLFHYLKPYWLTLIVLLAALLAGAAVQLGLPRILGAFIDQVLGGAGAATLARLALSYLALAGANQLLGLVIAYLGQNLAWKTTNALRADLFGHCLGLGLGFHNQRTPGELIQRIDGDVGDLSNTLSQFSVRIFGNLLLLGGVLVMLSRTDWRIGAALAVFALATLVVLQLTRSIAVPAHREESETVARIAGYIEERLGGAHDIRSNGAVQHVLNGLFLLGRRRLATISRSYFMGSLRWGIAMATLLIGNILALGTGAWLYLAGRATIGTVYIIYNYTNMLLDPLREISDQLQDFQKASAAMARIQELFALPPEPVGSSPAGEALPAGALPVELADLSFSYEDGTNALTGITARLAPGRVLGVIGRTGSGKSTLARLLVRFYEPSAGELRVGERDIRRVSLSDLRSKVALVTQEVQLFQASVRDNVTLFDAAVSDDRITQALAEVGLTAWLQSLPAGLDTRIASGGGGLSAGEAQLLAFARVLLRDPGLVILDEASSRLDPVTERLLDQAMVRLLKGRTAVVIAHRLATLERVDDILVLEGGRVVEAGERARLAADPQSRYGQLRRFGGEELLA
ncbi:MAG: ABC transporter ATP-binding protein [Chloroflexota bacterium]